MDVIEKLFNQITNWTTLDLVFDEDGNLQYPSNSEELGPIYYEKELTATKDINLIYVTKNGKDLDRLREYLLKRLEPLKEFREVGISIQLGDSGESKIIDITSSSLGEILEHKIQLSEKLVDMLDSYIPGADISNEKELSDKFKVHVLVAIGAIKGIQKEQLNTSDFKVSQTLAPILGIKENTIKKAIGEYKSGLSYKQQENLNTFLILHGLKKIE